MNKKINAFPWRNADAFLITLSIIISCGAIIFSEGWLPRWGFLISLVGGGIFLKLPGIIEIDLRYVLFLCVIVFSIGIYLLIINRLVRPDGD